MRLSDTQALRRAQCWTLAVIVCAFSIYAASISAVSAQLLAVGRTLTGRTEASALPDAPVVAAVSLLVTGMLFAAVIWRDSRRIPIALGAWLAALAVVVAAERLDGFGFLDNWPPLLIAIALVVTVTLASLRLSRTQPNER